MIKSVTQKHGMGCGVACVAAVLDISYDSALRLFKKPEQAWSKGFLCRDIVKALLTKKINYRFKFVKNRKDKVLFKTGTIVFTQASKSYPHGHYLVKTKRGWMNPWVNFPEITPAKSAIVKELPGPASYAIYRSDLEDVN